jgi:hypothetical protein
LEARPATAPPRGQRTLLHRQEEENHAYFLGWAAAARAFFEAAFLGFLFSLFFGLLSPIRIASSCTKVAVLYNKNRHLSHALLVVDAAAQVILKRLALFP